jgi:hypothetical protein
LLRLFSVVNWLNARLFAVSLTLLFHFKLGIGNSGHWLRTCSNLMCYGFDCLDGIMFTCHRCAVIPIMTI